MQKSWHLVGPLLLVAATARPAWGGETSITLGEVAVPPVNSGLDRAALKQAAERELSGVDPDKVRALRRKRSVVVSVAVIGGQQSPFGCTINAMLRDAKTGTMFAIVEGRARADGVANPALREQVLRAAMHSALSQIPAALAAD